MRFVFAVLLAGSWSALKVRPSAVKMEMQDDAACQRLSVGKLTPTQSIGASDDSSDTDTPQGYVSGYGKSPTDGSLFMIIDEQMHDGHPDPSRIRKSPRQFGERQKKQAIKPGRIARLVAQDRCRDLLPDPFAIDREAGRNAEQCADQNVARIMDAEKYPSHRREGGKHAEEQSPPPRDQPQARRDREQVGGVVARKAAPVFEVGVPLEARRAGAKRVHRAIAIG